LKEKYASTPFSGDSAALYPGRWNSDGVKLIYTAGSLSLSALELFVHLQNDGLGIKFVYVKVEIPERIKIVEVGTGSLPKDWRSCPAPESTQLFGANWANSKDSLILKVPSVVIPSEHDYLINPLHPDYSFLKIPDPITFSFDPRMWK
jgi:RES domain-containing protein